MEYPAMIYKNTISNVYMANCVVKNITGFGKTEEDALNNLKNTLQEVTNMCDITLKPMYGFLSA